MKKIKEEPQKRREATKTYKIKKWIESNKDWITIIIEIAFLIIAIYGVIVGVDQLKEINLNLDNLRTKNIFTDNITVTGKICYNENCTSYTYNNGSGTIMT